VSGRNQSGMRAQAAAGSAPLAAASFAIALALFAVALLFGRSVRADERTGAAEDMDYASPLEVLLSPDGARLYVLCQQSEDVRVVDAASYAVIKNIAVGRVPRGFSLSPDGARLFVTNSWTIRCR